MGQIVKGEKIHHHDTRPRTGDYEVGSVFQCACGQYWVLVTNAYGLGGGSGYWNRWMECEDKHGTREFCQWVPDPDGKQRMFRPEPVKLLRTHEVRNYFKDGQWVAKP